MPKLILVSNVLMASAFVSKQQKKERILRKIAKLQAELEELERKPRMLELFKGTGSIGKIAEEMGYEVVSLDILAKYKPTIVSDILTWDYTEYEPGYFDVIWSSPECKIFSPLQTTHCMKVGKTQADYKKKMKWESMEHLWNAQQENGKFVKQVLKIIKYFEPKEWFIENPWNSKMKDLEFMKDLPSYRFDYCRFGYPYQKPTRIWTNKKFENMTCNCKKNPKTGKKHAFNIGISSAQLLREGMDKDTTTLDQRYSIPPKLVKHLLE